MFDCDVWLFRTVRRAVEKSPGDQTGGCPSLLAASCLLILHDNLRPAPSTTAPPTEGTGVGRPCFSRFWLDDKHIHHHYRHRHYNPRSGWLKRRRSCSIGQEETFLNYSGRGCWSNQLKIIWNTFQVNFAILLFCSLYTVVILNKKKFKRTYVRI